MNLFISVLLIFISCTQQNNVDNYLKKLDVANPIDSIVLELDSLSGFYSFSLNIDEEKNEISIYNNFINSIDFYDFNSGKLINRIVLGFIKNKSTNDLFNYYHFKYNDSLIIYDLGSGTLTSIDSKGRVLKQDSIIINNNRESFPNPSTTAPVIIDGHNIIFPANIFINDIEDQTSLCNFYLFDYRNFNRTCLMNRIDDYNLGHWGNNGGLFKTSSSYNRNTKEIYYSSPISDSIYIINPSGEISSIEFKSSFIQPVKPLKTNKKASVSSLESLNYEYKTSHYQHIQYDEIYNKLYRFLYVGTTDSDFFDNNENMINGRHEIILVGEINSKKTSQYLLPHKKYYTHMQFMKNGILYIANREKYLENNNFLIFDGFKL